MVAKKSKQEKKSDQFEKIQTLLNEYPKILLVDADNVGSLHMQRIRQNLRGEAVLMMGKNTLIRRAMRQVLASNSALETLIPFGELGHIRDLLVENRVAAPARAGAIAPCSVVVPAGNTGLEPTQTSFLQALNIPSKINKGAVEIISDVHLIAEGDKVGASEATLLQKLKIKPFTYGLSCKHIYENGSVNDPKVLDITVDDVIASFQKGIQNIAALGLEIHYGTVATVPHLLVNAFKNLVGLCMESDYTFDAMDKMNEMAANPQMVVAAVEATETTTTDVKEPEPEEEDEEDGDMGFDMFG